MWAHVFPRLPFAANVPVAILLVALYIPCQIQLQEVFGFLNAISVGLNSVSKFIPGHLPCFNFLYTLFLCLSLVGLPDALA